MALPDEVVNTPSTPSWKELQEFINKQGDKDRALIDYWFKMAATVLGLLLLVAGGAIGFFGFKTLADARSAAENAAQEAAKAKVKEVLQEPRIQKLVEETAQQLFKSGAFQRAIEAETAAQLKSSIPAEIRRTLPGRISNELANLSLTPRIVLPALDQKFRVALSAFAGEGVLLDVCATPEASRFG